MAIDKKLRRPLTFFGVGILNTILDFLFYTALVVFVFGGNEQIGLIGIISGTFALICAYTTHRLITWRDRPATTKTLISFFVFTGIGLWIIRPLLLVILIQMTALYTFIHGILQAIGLPIGYELVASTVAFGIMAAIVMVYNYIVYSRFVFKTNGTEQETH
jgi:putative flippase GtrA